MKKIKVISIAALAMFAMLAVGCSNPDASNSAANVSVSKVSASSLPKSGATKAVTEENAQLVMAQLPVEAMKDPLIGSLFGSVKFGPTKSVNGSSSSYGNSSLSAYLSMLPENIQEFVKEFENQDKKINNLKDGEEYDYSVVLGDTGKIEKIAGVSLEDIGVKASIDDLYFKAHCKAVTYKPNPEMNYTKTGLDATGIDAKVRASVSVDVDKVLGTYGSLIGVTGKSMIKGVAANVAAAVTGDVKSSETLVSGAAGAAVSAGVSFCLPDGTGGILLVNAKVGAKATIDQEASEKINKALKEENYAFLSDYLTASVKVSFLDDNGKETYVAFEEDDVEEIVKLALSLTSSKGY